MASRRRAHCDMRRGNHSQMRQGYLPPQSSVSTAGPGGSGKAAKPGKAQKAQRA